MYISTHIYIYMYRERERRILGGAFIRVGAGADPVRDR